MQRCCVFSISLMLLLATSLMKGQGAVQQGACAAEIPLAGSVKASDSEAPEIWFLGGQSNMQGNAKVNQLASFLEKELPWEIPNVFFWNGQSFEPLVVGETKTSSRAGEFGPEIGFAATMANPGRPLYLVKYSASGMPLHHGINGNAWVGEEFGPGRRNFYPGVDYEDPNAGTLYRAMRDRFTAALKFLREEDKEVRIGGFLWMQGEQDSKHEIPAKNYARSLAQLRERLDEDLQVPGEMPIIYGQVLPHSPALPRFLFREEIRQQMALADHSSEDSMSIPWATMVSTDSFELQNDTVHYDHRGQWKLGVAMAEAATRRSQAPEATPKGALRIDQLRLLGTHNSYHIAPDAIASAMISLVAPDEAKAIDCTQCSLTEQLSRLGVRHFELDLYRDPDGSMYRKPVAYTVAQQQQADVPSFDPEQRLHASGIKVLHSPDFDFRTTVYTFEDALREVRAWSDRNRDHVPLFLLLELKSDSFSPLTRPLPWDGVGFSELEETIRRVFPRERLLLPRDVQRGMPTLRDAVIEHGWPTVESQRGKVAFLLDNGGGVRDRYMAAAASGEGALLFTSVDRSHPSAAWMKCNDPVGQFDEICSLVKSGFLVRTRADAGLVEARTGDVTRRDKAIASGAQLISTDFPEPDPRFPAYQVLLPAPK